MKVCIVHYHLRPGGVTTVIANAVKSLASHGVRVAVLTGEMLHEPVDGLDAVRVVDGLGYSDGGREAPIAGRMTDAACDALDGPPDLWHIHNHALGKNLALPAATCDLAARGERLLLHIHDFAEDGRPGNYRSLAEGLDGVMPWPMGAHVHYAALNRRDHAFLAEAGVPESNLHDLPNAVAPMERAAPPDASDSVTLYVTRAIRRKNLGEFLLWAAVANSGERFEISRAPRNPAARPVYDRWVALVHELGLPVTFEAGADASLADLMQRATRLATTSVAEGFGLAFLEPWLAGRRLVGRDLPEITPGLTAAGVDLSGLYTRLDVPVEWVGGDALRARLRSALAGSLSAYGRELTDEIVERAYSAAVQNGRADFGRLDETLQEAVIRRAPDEPDALTPSRLESDCDAGLIDRNAQAVTRTFNLDHYGERLVEIYGRVMAGGAEGRFNAHTLLDRFLAPERFCLLRAGEGG